jgi:hypothetical protein
MQITIIHLTCPIGLSLIKIFYTFILLTLIFSENSYIFCKCLPIICLNVVLIYSVVKDMISRALSTFNYVPFCFRSPYFKNNIFTF